MTRTAVQLDRKCRNCQHGHQDHDPETETCPLAYNEQVGNGKSDSCAGNLVFGEDSSELERTTAQQGSNNLQDAVLAGDRGGRVRANRRQIQTQQAFEVQVLLGMRCLQPALGGPRISKVRSQKVHQTFFRYVTLQSATLSALRINRYTQYIQIH